MPTSLILAVLLVTIILAVLVAVRPSLTVARGGKVLAFLAFFIFPVFAGLLGLENHMERAKQTSFCLTCHIMGRYGQSLYVDDASYIPAAHFQNGRIPRDEACYTCHTDYSIFGGFKSKFRGLHHVYAQYVTTPKMPIKLYHPYNNRECLHCHEGSRSFEQGAIHTAEPQTMADIKSNKLSCTTSGCHDTIHNVKQLDHAKFWKPVQ
jgi:cytochrome c-type protein NapC